MSSVTVIQLILCVTLVSACSRIQAPPCPVEDDGVTAPSAGCFAVENGKLLLVQSMKGQVNLPGGSSNSGESAQCAAHRETWEETGLHLKPGELEAVFSTGFHLYRCSRGQESGEIDPPPRLEVQGAFYLEADEFDEYEWRFPEQRDALVKLLDQSD